MPKVEGYTFQKVGRSMKDSMAESPVKSNDDHMMYPTLHLDGYEIEGLEGYEVGDQVQLVIKGVVASKSMNQSKGGKKNHSCSIDIHTIGFPAGKAKSNSDDDMDEDDEYTNPKAKVAAKRARKSISY